MSPDYSHIVVGAGISGSWAAAHLARRGATVLLIDQFPLPHSRGSSHGQSRGIRRAYPDPVFTRMMEEAYTGWEELEQLQGVKLIKETGLLCFADSPTNPFVCGVISSFQQSPGSEHSVYRGREFKERFPFLTFPNPITGCLDPRAGVIMADKALRAVQDLAVSCGAVIRDSCPVTRVESVEEGVKVEAGGEVFSCSSVILTPGPWAGGILDKLGVTLPLSPVKIPVYYWRAPNFLSQTFIYECGGWDVWGLPPLEYPGLAKICLHEGPAIDPDNRDSVSTDHLKASLQQFISRHFPGVDPSVAVEESCIYTLTPDQNPVIDRLPDHPNIVLGVGFSGMGFKLAPVTGRMLADLAQGRKGEQEELCLSYRRFLAP